MHNIRNIKNVLKYVEFFVFLLGECYCLRKYHLHKSLFTYENQSLKITVEKPGTYSVIFANYSGNQMKDIKEVPTALNAGINDVKIPDNFTLSNGSKVFLWNSLFDLFDFEPLCEEITIE